LLTLLTPTFSVAILTFTVTVRGSRRAVWRDFGLGRLRANSSRVWLTALLVPALLLALAYGAAIVLGYADLVHVNTGPASVASFVADLLISLVLGSVLILGEEIGWRGYLLPRVQQLTDRRRAAVLTGFAHGCFHLPLILIATTYDADGARWFVATSVVATITAAGVFYAYVRDLSVGVWPVAVAHNTANTLFDIGSRATVPTGSAASLAYVAGESGLATLGAVSLLALWLLRRAAVWQTSKARTELLEVGR
jgi:membrane protease YdiL (CAAX protease family)